MKYVYVKDSEGFVCRKAADCVLEDETIITEAEFRSLSGDDYYEEKFGHGGKREGAGRKTRFSEPLKYQIRVTEQEKEFILYAREKGFDYGKAMLAD